MSDYTNLSLGDQMLVDSYTKPLHHEIEQTRTDLAEAQLANRALQASVAVMQAKLTRAKTNEGEMFQKAHEEIHAANALRAKLDCALKGLRFARELIRLRHMHPPVDKEITMLTIDRALAGLGGVEEHSPDTSQLERFRKALEFYANGAERIVEHGGTKHWVREFGCGCCAQSYEVEEDGGRGAMDCELDDIQGTMAREALAGTEKEPKV